MPSRNVYHVVPSEGQWAVRREGADAVSARQPSEDEALRAAVDIVRSLGVGRVVVHGDDGRIAAVHTYDQLPVVTERPWLEGVLSQPALVALAAGALIGLGIALARRP